MSSQARVRTSGFAVAGLPSARKPAACEGRLLFACAKPQARALALSRTTGTAFQFAAFHGLDAATMIRALDVLEAEGKAEVFRQEALDETGVKFKPRS